MNHSLRIISLIVSILIFCVPITAAALDFTSEEYEKAAIDYNQDGRMDILWQGPTRFVLLHGKVRIPLNIQLDSIVWVQNANKTYSAIFPADKALVSSLPKSPMLHQFYLEDLQFSLNYQY